MQPHFPWTMEVSSLCWTLVMTRTSQYLSESGGFGGVSDEDE